jgi:ribosome biogenesis protein SSF1/2
MAHPRKKRRTQAPGVEKNAMAMGVTKTNAADRTPKSMVIRMGASDVGPSVTQLVKDMRSVMEPHTATKLKERRSNRLRDYATMAGPLGVSHFLLFSRSDSGNTNLRVAITPRGPTLSFRVEKYSLCKDVAKSQRHPKSASGGVEHLTPPLVCRLIILK